MNPHLSPSRYPIIFDESEDFLNYDPSQGRMDHRTDRGITLSAIPDPSGKTIWEAKSADGKRLKTFGMAAFEAVAGFDLVTPESPGWCWLCYEDELGQQSRCKLVRCTSM